MVRLKGPLKDKRRAGNSFQFLMVRLKAIGFINGKSVDEISIPYGSIKSLSDICTFQLYKDFNSLWFD